MGFSDGQPVRKSMEDKSGPCGRTTLQLLLNGTSQKKETNRSLLKYLPPELLEKIWLEYAYSLENKEIVKLGLVSVLSKKFEDGLVSTTEMLIYYMVENNIDNLDMIDWCIKNNFSLCVPRTDKIYDHVMYMMDDAHWTCILIGKSIKNKNIDMVKYFIASFPTLRNQFFVARFLLDMAVWSQNLEIIDLIYNYVDLATYSFSRWFLRENIPNVVEIATILNNNQLLEWLRPRFPFMKTRKYICEQTFDLQSNIKTVYVYFFL